MRKVRRNKMSNYSKEYYESHKEAYFKANKKRYYKKKEEEAKLVLQVMKEIEYKGLSLEVEEYLRKMLTKRYEKLTK